jgi:nucleotide sugar dehydrogenase
LVTESPKNVNDDADVCVVGLGYVGLTLATAFAESGLRVVGVERDARIVHSVANGRATFHEVGLDEALASVVGAGRLSVVSADDPYPPARSYVITVGTPLRGGQVFLDDIRDALTRVGGSMPEGALVVLRSTVRVGTSTDIAMPTLRATGKGFALAMAPERTIEGRALAELTSLPQIVGGMDEASFASASSLFSKLGVEIVRVGSLAAAELAKLSSNTYRDLQFAFANELAMFADAAGVDVYDVIHACNYGYERVNLAFPGPVAGPCLEKDAYILSESATLVGGSVPLSMQGRTTNEGLVVHVRRMATEMVPVVPERIGILGLAFKGRPATSDVRGTLARDFAVAFKTVWPSSEVCGWDPVVSPDDAGSVGIQFDELASVIAGSALLLIQTNHRFFSSTEFSDLLAEHAARNTVIIDLWNQLDAFEQRRTDVRVAVYGRMTAGMAR